MTNKPLNLSIISAVANNNVIGKDNQLLWKLSEDLKRFRSLTLNHVVIMGQKTYESIGMPLPNRFNIIITDDYNFKTESIKMDSADVYVVHSIEHALDTAEYYNDNDLEVFVIGGGSIYRQFMKYCQRLYITRIHKDFDGDAFFPEIDPEIWELVWNDDMKKNTDFEYQYQIYNKKKGT